ncbi:MAG: N-acetyltransferase family protein [Ktedonobacterales bacterium]
MAEITSVSAAMGTSLLPQLIDLLCDAVESGASLGFWHPLSDEDAERYWRGILADVDGGRRILLIAREQGLVSGAVQLEPAQKQNATHRAEVQKLMVRRSARRQGLGRALMHAVEAEARAAHRTLLVLDTRTGDSAESLYRALGYTEAGRIPAYVREPDGSLSSTTIFYKHLQPTRPRLLYSRHSPAAP